MENCATLTAVGPRLRQAQVDKHNMNWKLNSNLLNKKNKIIIYTKDKWWDRSLFCFSCDIILPPFLLYQPPPLCPAMPTSQKPFSWICGDSSNSNTSGGNHLCLQASHYRSRVWDCCDKTLSLASRPARDQLASPHSLLHTSSPLSFYFHHTLFFYWIILCFFSSCIDADFQVICI